MSLASAHSRLSCETAGAPPDGCNDDAGCIFCNAVGDPYSAGCAITAEATGSNTTRCQGLGMQGLYFVDAQPFFLVKYPEGTFDAEGGEDVFYAQGNADAPFSEFAQYKYLLNRDTWLLVDPCAPTPYCVFGQGSIWLCRIFFQGTQRGWWMWCNSTEAGGYGEDQLVDKPILIELDVDYGLVFVHLTSGRPAPDCFSPLYDVQCFSSACDGESWDCTSSTLAQNLNHLYIDLVDLHYSMDETAFAQRNPYDIELKNAVWATLAPLVEQVDHNSSESYNSTLLYEWRHVGQFADSPVVQGHPPGGTGEGDFPGAYADLAGQPIPLKARSFLTGQELPAVLTLQGVGIVLHLHAEEVVSIEDSDVCGPRVFADIIIRVLVRVQLLPAAYGFEGYPFELVGRPDGGTDDPYDLRVEDPDNPGQIHPVERLTVVGPHNERVPTQVYSGDVAAPVITIPHLSWRGLKTSRKFSRGPNEAVWNDDLVGCCRAYWAIDGTVIFGELNDCSELQTDGSAVIKPQRYQGGVVIHPWSLTGCGP